MRAVRHVDRLVRAQKESIGLAKGGEQYHRSTGVSNTPVLPTLAAQGIDKNLAKQARALGALSDEKFETVVAEARDRVAYAVRKVVREIEVEVEHEALSYEEAAPSADAPTIMLKTHLGEEVPYKLPKGKPEFNRTNQMVDWAAWTTNPITGCLHGCPYCYAREMAEMRESYRHAYPVGFTPLFHHERLDAPANTPVPEEAKNDPRLGRVFVGSMADAFGKWVPQEWLEKMFAVYRANLQWEYLFLTKFPQRYVGLELPPTAWIGTSVDTQSRVKYAVDAFRQIKDVRAKWLSLEPLLDPLDFKEGQLEVFDWVVIGAQSATRQPKTIVPSGHVPEFAPPFEWVANIVAQARKAGCRVYLKPNLLGANPNPQSPGMALPQEEPLIKATP
jgi:protein gp37